MSSVVNPWWSRLHFWRRVVRVLPVFFFSKSVLLVNHCLQPTALHMSLCPIFHYGISFCSFRDHIGVSISTFLIVAMKSSDHTSFQFKLGKKVSWILVYERTCFPSRHFVWTATPVRLMIHGRKRIWVRQTLQEAHLVKILSNVHVVWWG